MTSIVPRFYVYVLCRPNGKPFYVGKGSGRRIFNHDAEARRNCQCYKCRVIRKVWQRGGEVQRYTVFTTDDEAEAYAYECELIALYGRNALANGTNGGIGGSGHVVSPEVRQLQRELRKSNWSDPEYRQRMTNMSQALANNPEWRAKLSEIGKARFADPAEREKASQAQRKRYEDPAEHAKQSAANHIRWSDPEQRQRLAERNKTPEMHSKLSATRKAQWTDPEYRAKMLAHRERKK